MQLEQMKGKLAGQADENEMSKLKNNMVFLVTTHKTSLNIEKIRLKRMKRNLAGRADEN